MLPGVSRGSWLTGTRSSTVLLVRRARWFLEQAGQQLRGRRVGERFRLQAPPGTDRASVEALVLQSYNQAPRVTARTAVPLLRLARAWRDADMEAAVWRFVSDPLKSSTVLAWFDEAPGLGLLQQACVFAEASASRILRSPDFLLASGAALRRFLWLEGLRASEELVGEAVVQWARAQAVREGSAPDASSVSVADVSEILRREGLLGLAPPSVVVAGGPFQHDQLVDAPRPTRRMYTPWTQMSWATWRVSPVVTLEDGVLGALGPEMGFAVAEGAHTRGTFVFELEVVSLAPGSSDDAIVFGTVPARPDWFVDTLEGQFFHVESGYLGTAETVPSSADPVSAGDVLTCSVDLDARFMSAACAGTWIGDELPTARPCWVCVGVCGGARVRWLPGPSDHDPARKAPIHPVHIGGYAFRIHCTGLRTVPPEKDAVSRSEEASGGGLEFSDDRHDDDNDDDEDEEEEEEEEEKQKDDGSSESSSSQGEENGTGDIEGHDEPEPRHPAGAEAATPEMDTIVRDQATRKHLRAVSSRFRRAKVVVLSMVAVLWLLEPLALIWRGLARTVSAFVAVWSSAAFFSDRAYWLAQGWRIGWTETSQMLATAYGDLVAWLARAPVRDIGLSALGASALLDDIVASLSTGWDAAVIRTGWKWFSALQLALAMLATFTSVYSRLGLNSGLVAGRMELYSLRLLGLRFGGPYPTWGDDMFLVATYFFLTRILVHDEDADFFVQRSAFGRWWGRAIDFSVGGIALFSCWWLRDEFPRQVFESLFIVHSVAWVFLAWSVYRFLAVMARSGLRPATFLRLEDRLGNPHRPDNLRRLVLTSVLPQGGTLLVMYAVAPASVTNVFMSGTDMLLLVATLWCSAWGLNRKNLADFSAFHVVFMVLMVAVARAAPPYLACGMAAAPYLMANVWLCGALGIELFDWLQTAPILRSSSLTKAAAGLSLSGLVFGSDAPDEWWLWTTVRQAAFVLVYYLVTSTRPLRRAPRYAAFVETPLLFVLFARVWTYVTTSLLGHGEVPRGLWMLVLSGVRSEMLRGSVLDVLRLAVPRVRRRLLGPLPPNEPDERTPHAKVLLGGLTSGLIFEVATWRAGLPSLFEGRADVWAWVLGDMELCFAISQVVCASRELKVLTAEQNSVRDVGFARVPLPLLRLAAWVSFCAFGISVAIAAISVVLWSCFEDGFLWNTSVSALKDIVVECAMVRSNSN